MKTLFRWIFGLGALALIAFGLSWLIFMPSISERGVWKAEAGGMILSISRSRADVYRETSISCAHQLAFPAHMKIVELLEGATLETINGKLHLIIDTNLEPTVFNRIDALPDHCGEIDPEQATARQVFDVLWAAMNEHYAFFDLHSVDWQARQALAPAPDAELTDLELYALLQDTLVGLDDGHVQLVAGELGYFSPATPPPWVKMAGLNRAELTQIARDNSGVSLNPVTGTMIEYGLRDDAIGYVLIRGMSADRPFGGATMQATQQAFSKVADGLAGAKAIIVDLRYNPGGDDAVALGIASHFAGQVTPILTKSSRNGDQQGPSFEAVVHPYDETPLVQDVIVLTTRATASGAEIFTMAMREMPQVTTMGEATSGGLSDILDFTLPNGWSLGLSNQTYLTTDGQLFEGKGIPPDVEFAMDPDALKQGEDPLLQAAIDRALQ